MNMKIKALASCELDQGGPEPAKPDVNQYLILTIKANGKCMNDIKNLSRTPDLPRASMKKKMRHLIDTLEV